MFVVVRTSEQARQQLNDFKTCFFQEGHHSIVKRNGKTWRNIGILSGPLNERALKVLSRNYWIKVIFTLGLSLVFSKEVKEMRATLKTGHQERKIYIEWQNAEYGTIFNIARQQNAQKKPPPSSFPVVEEQETKEIKEETAPPIKNSLQELKQLKFQDPNFIDTTLIALKEDPKQTISYLFCEREGSVEEKAHLFEKMASQLLEKDWVAIADQVVQLNQGDKVDLVILKKIPENNAAFKAFALLIVKRHPHLMVAVTEKVIKSNQLKIDKNDYLEIAEGAIKAAGDKAYSVIANIPADYRPKQKRSKASKN